MDQVLLRIEQNLLQVPEGVEIVTFVKNGGRVVEKAAPAPERITLKKLIDA